MNPKFCVCGAIIPKSRELCKDCLRVYGPDSKKWPKWLKEWIRLDRHERYYERAHFDESLESLEYAYYQGDDNNIYARNKWIANAKSRKIDYINEKLSHYVEARIGRLQKIFGKDYDVSIVRREIEKEYAKNFTSPSAPPPYTDERLTIDFWIDFQYALFRIKEIERKVILMCFLDFTEREIAAAIGISQSHVNAIKKKTLIKLAVLLT